MDYVYSCRDGDNEELRYSIRSVVKNGNPNRIWVIGGKPDWYSGNFIEVPQTEGNFKNSKNNIKTAISNKTISDNFVLMNDDFFLLKPRNDHEYHSGLLNNRIKEYMSINGNSSYARTLVSAREALKEKGILEPLNYDIHVPMTLNKALLSEVIDLSLSFRSVYGNLFYNNSLNIDDVKIYKNTENISFDRDFISTEDNSFSLIMDDLKRMFPDPTKYEI